MTSSRSSRVLMCSMVLVLLAAMGCGDNSGKSASGGKEQNAPTATEQPKTPLIQKQQVADWCKEHGVPESICTRCNESLVADFKKKGDWCKEHDLPESQCLKCHPDLEAKFKAMAPKEQGGK